MMLARRAVAFMGILSTLLGIAVVKTPSWRPDPSLRHQRHLATVAAPRLLSALEWPLCWVNEDEVLSTELPYCIPSDEDHYWIVDVRTGRRRNLPTVRNHNDVVTLSPHPSPDGKWLLYAEVKESENKGTWFRWRLTRTDGSETRYLPSDGSFRGTDEYPEGIQWLSDGSGWIVGETRGARITGYRLATPDAAPQTISVPEPGVWRLRESGALFAYDRQTGQVLFASPSATDQVQRAEMVKDPEFMPLTLSLGLSFTKPGQGYDNELVSGDGNWTVACWSVHSTGILWWLNKVSPRPDHLEARLISLRDQSYWVFPWIYEDDKPDDAVLSVSLSPHGRRAIYDKDGRWYVTELPTRENGQWK